MHQSILHTSMTNKSNSRPSLGTAVRPVDAVTTNLQVEARELSLAGCRHGAVKQSFWIVQSLVVDAVRQACLHQSFLGFLPFHFAKRREHQIEDIQSTVGFDGGWPGLCTNR